MINKTRANLGQLWLLLLLLTSCSQSAKQKPSIYIPTLPSAPPAPTPISNIGITTAEIHPTNISTVMPSMTSLPSPTLSPIATLNPDVAQLKIVQLMATNDECGKNCFWGITPGTTTFDNAVLSLSTLRQINLLKNKDGTFQYNSSFEYKKGDIALSIIFSDSDNEIQSLWVLAVGLESQHVTGKDWLAFRPDQFLKVNGVPKQINIAMYEEQGGEVSYEMMFLYDQTYIKYSGNQIIIKPQAKMHVCPLRDQNVKRFELILGQYDHGKWGDGIDLTQISSISTDQFYQIMVGDPTNACFDLDYNKYLSPN